MLLWWTRVVVWWHCLSGFHADGFLWIISQADELSFFVSCVEILRRSAGRLWPENVWLTYENTNELWWGESWLYLRSLESHGNRLAITKWCSDWWRIEIVYATMNRKLFSIGLWFVLECSILFNIMKTAMNKHAELICVWCWKISLPAADSGDILKLWLLCGCCFG